MTDTSLKHYMSRDVTAADSTASLAEVISLMRTNVHSCVVVVDRGYPIGIITERDIVRLINDDLYLSCTKTESISKVMTTPIETMSHDAQLDQAITHIQENNYRHLPVVDNEGLLVGIITQSDLITAHDMLLRSQKSSLENFIAKRTKALRDANESLRLISLEDPLTKLGNRRSMEMHLSNLHAQAQRYHQHYGLAILDIDFFKKYNDRYGHVLGDEVLSRVAEELKKNIRETDKLYRYGGEEVLLAMPSTDYEGAKNLTQRLVDSVYKLEIEHQDSPHHYLTISAGLAIYESDKTLAHWQELIETADIALYAAKHRGKNMVMDEKTLNEDDT